MSPAIASHQRHLNLPPRCQVQGLSVQHLVPSSPASPASSQTACSGATCSSHPTPILNQCVLSSPKFAFSGSCSHQASWLPGVLCEPEKQLEEGAVITSAAMRCAMHCHNWTQGTQLEQVVTTVGSNSPVQVCRVTQELQCPQGSCERSTCINCQAR